MKCNHKEQKGQGADAFFKSTTPSESIEKTHNFTSIDTNTGTYTLPYTSTDKATSSNTNTSLDTGADSVLDSLLSNTEEFVRCVAYLRKDQADFVKNLSKQLTKKNKREKNKRIRRSLEWLWIC